MRIPFPDKPEPESNMEIPVPVIQNGIWVRNRKIWYPVPVSKTAFRSYPRLECVVKMCGGCQESVWSLSGRCLDFSGTCLQGVWRLSGRCLQCVCKVYAMCLEGVWNVSGTCMEGVWKVC